MLNSNRIFSLIILSLFFLEGCALSSKTTIDVFDESFKQATNSQPTVGLIYMNWTTTQKTRERDKALGMFGAAGALTSIAIQSAQDAVNDEVEAVSLTLYKKDLPYLKRRLVKQTSFTFINSEGLEKIDPVEFSRNVRSKRAWGWDEPTDEQVRNFFKENNHDFALYVANQGGIFEYDGSMFVSTNWGILDPEGKEIVSVFTRTVEKNGKRHSNNRTTYIQKLSELFRYNLEEFLRVLNGKKPVNSEN